MREQFSSHAKHRYQLAKLRYVKSHELYFRLAPLDVAAPLGIAPPPMPPPRPAAGGIVLGSMAMLMKPINPADTLYPSERISTKAS